MGTLIDLTGMTFGRWTVVAKGPTGSRGRSHWICECACGTRRSVEAGSLRCGDSRSCGCLKNELLVARRLSHGHKSAAGGSREYHSWSNAKSRCYNPRNKRFAAYGGRGVIVCERWRTNFDAFLADMGPCPPDYTLDRIDTLGNYEPSNCRWADWATQRKNQRRTASVMWGGVAYVLSDLAGHLGVGYQALRYQYVTLGLPIDDAVAVARDRPAPTVTQELAATIRERYARGDGGQRELGVVYGLSRDQVSRILRPTCRALRAS